MSLCGTFSEHIAHKSLAERLCITSYSACTSMVIRTGSAAHTEYGFRTWKKLEARPGIVTDGKEVSPEGGLRLKEGDPCRW